jgi:hypothetical protein
LWSYNTTKLWAIHITLGVLATFFSLLAAALTGNSGNSYNEWVRVSAFIAALSISVMTAFNLGTKSNNVRNAWRILNYAIIKFNHNLIQTNEVIGVYEEGESLIGGVTYTTSGIAHEEPAPKIQKQKQNDENKEEKEPNLQKNGDGEKS